MNEARARSHVQVAHQHLGYIELTDSSDDERLHN